MKILAVYERSAIMKMRTTIMASKAQQLKDHLQPGTVYRRGDLARWSNAVDRHLKELQQEGTLTRLAGGLYLCPKPTAFGAAPAEDTAMVQAFLKDKRFLVFSANAYNSLGLGTTQLYNETLVYNHKRHGSFVLGDRRFEFHLKPHFPPSLSEAFLLVDLVNHPERLAEDQDVVERVKARAQSLDQGLMATAVQDYGGVRARKFFADVLKA
jgi:hypothetical protein